MNISHFYLSTQGRIGRKTFWLLGALPLTAYFVVMLLVCQYVSIEMDDTIGLWEFFFAILLMVWPLVAINAKRWHDRGKSAWWMLICLIPFAGIIWSLVETGFLKGTPGLNRFGEKK